MALKDFSFLFLLCVRMILDQAIDHDEIVTFLGQVLTPPPSPLPLPPIIASHLPLAVVSYRIHPAFKKKHLIK